MSTTLTMEQSDSSSPQPPRRKKLIWAVGVVVFLVLLFGSNFYIARHRDVYVANGFAQPVTAIVADHGSVTVPPGGLSLLSLPEGRHRVVFRGGLEDKTDIEIHGSFLGRWLDKPAFVINPGGAAMLVWEETAPGTAGVQNAAESFRFHYGEVFVSYPNVDYLFQEFPPSLRAQGAAANKTRIDLVKVEPMALFFGYLNRGRFDEALKLAEWDLRLRPATNQLINAYLAIARQQKRESQAAEFLRKGLSRRPVDMAWHRAYQELFAEGMDVDKIALEYDALLAGEPTNSALLYLRGRLCTSEDEALGYLERAVACDPQNAFAHNALGFRSATGGDWANARARFARARELMPADPGFSEYLFEARLALGEYAALEAELRAAVKPGRLDVRLHQKLCDVLVAQQKTDEAKQLFSEFERASRARFQERAQDSIDSVRFHLLYLTGDFAGLEQAAALNRSSNQEWIFQALLESGRLDDAEKVLPQSSADLDGPWLTLAMSVAWERAGNPTKAGEWRQKAAAQMNQGRKEWRRVAVALQSGNPTSMQEYRTLPLPFQSKSLLLIAQAQRFPAQRAELLPLARSLNVVRTFPYHLIRSAGDKLK